VNVVFLNESEKDIEEDIEGDKGEKVSEKGELA
jgi:hypothetical protein